MEPTFKLTNAEARLAGLIWDNEPIASMALVKLAHDKFAWSKSTTFTHLKKLIEKGLSKNESSSVTMLYTREEVVAEQSCRYIDETFSGSLPLFVASFTRNRKLSAEQLDEMKRIIDYHEAGEDNG
jgi:predicted transcriptional regulator